MKISFDFDGSGLNLIYNKNIYLFWRKNEKDLFIK